MLIWLYVVIYTSGQDVRERQQLRLNLESLYFSHPFVCMWKNGQQNGGVFHCVNWTCSSLYCKKESISIKRKHYPK